MQRRRPDCIVHPPVWKKGDSFEDYKSSVFKKLSFTANVQYKTGDWTVSNDGFAHWIEIPISKPMPITNTEPVTITKLESAYTGGAIPELELLEILGYSLESITKK